MIKSLFGCAFRIGNQLMDVRKRRRSFRMSNVRDQKTCPGVARLRKGDKKDIVGENLQTPTRSMESQKQFCSGLEAFKHSATLPLLLTLSHRIYVKDSVSLSQFRTVKAVSAGAKRSPNNASVSLPRRRCELACSSCIRASPNSPFLKNSLPSSSANNACSW